MRAGWCYIAANPLNALPTCRLPSLSVDRAANWMIVTYLNYKASRFLSIGSQSVCSIAMCQRFLLFQTVRATNWRWSSDYRSMYLLVIRKMTHFEEWKVFAELSWSWPYLCRVIDIVSGHSICFAWWRYLLNTISCSVFERSDSNTELP